MLQHTLATMASEFATAIVRALRAAPMDELHAFLETSAMRTTATRAPVATKTETKASRDRARAGDRPTKPRATTKAARPSKVVPEPGPASAKAAPKSDTTGVAALPKTTAAETPAKASTEVTPRRSPKAKAARATTAPEATTPATRKRARDAQPEARPELSPSVLDAIVAFYVERATRGATERQVASHLEGLGLDTNASTAAVEALVANGTIRDAGFRRAAGRNATAPVYVANPPSGSSSPSFG
ncbi:MAG: hypothetical protein IPK71_07325 [Myxococcales bacterium]|nr:hypothetical protein [Myxococcales bacterium]